jgi:hypothetical protein
MVSAPTEKTTLPNTAQLEIFQRMLHEKSIYCIALDEDLQVLRDEVFRL